MEKDKASFKTSLFSLDLLGNFNVWQVAVMVAFIAYFLYSQHEFALLHTEIQALQAQLERCFEDMMQVIEMGNSA